MVHAPETIRLDTGAFGSARRRRLGRSLAYWLLLLAGVALLAGALAAAFTLLQNPAAATARLAPAKVAGAKEGKRSVAAATTTPREGAAAPAARREEAKAAAAPPPADTPVAIWNGFGGQGAATTVADRARARGYPVVGVRDAPRRTYRQTYVLYVPGREAAAEALAKRLGLTAAVVRPLDGIRPTAIKPAQLLVILAKQP